MEAERNLSVVLHATKDIRIENRVITALHNNEVLIKMQSVGICGSDVHYWQHGRIGDFILTAPMVLGHEGSGVVAAVGPNVESLKVGDRVAIEPGVPCRMCDFCKTGKYNLCPKVVFCATPPYDGNLSQYYAHAADFCYKLPDHLSFDEGAMLEPLSVAIHACRQGNISVGDSVLILGSGPIGLLNLLIVKASGAAQVCITDISLKRLEMAKKLGADHVIHVDTDEIKVLMKKVTEALGCSPNKTIECSGADQSVCLGVKVTKSGGTMVLVGLGKPEIKMPLIDAALREVTIRGVFRYANCYPTAISLLATGQVDVKPLITHRFKLQESIRAFEEAKAGTGIKVIISCN